MLKTLKILNWRISGQNLQKRLPTTVNNKYTQN